VWGQRGSQRNKLVSFATNRSSLPACLPACLPLAGGRGGKHGFALQPQDLPRLLVPEATPPALRILEGRQVAKCGTFVR
jgi:hypothetical protein